MTHTFRYVATGTVVAGGDVVLSGVDTHHLVRVVRRGRGDTVEIIDEAGRIWPATVEDLGPPARVTVAQAPRPAPRALPVDLFLGLVDWGRLDLVVQKCTELGVERIVVFTSERGRRRGDQEAFERRVERLGRLAEAAARQSGRGTGTRVSGLVPFSAMVADLDPAGTFLVDARGTVGLGAAMRARPAPRVGIVVGPDAGFADAELVQAGERGIAVCQLGDATLRAETAALAATAVAADVLGFLGAGAGS